MQHLSIHLDYRARHRAPVRETVGSTLQLVAWGFVSTIGVLGLVAYGLTFAGTVAGVL